MPDISMTSAITPMNTGMVTLNGVSVIDPSVLEQSVQTVSDPEAGRDKTGTMHDNPPCPDKLKYNLAWNGIDPVNASIILQAVRQQRFFPAILHNAVTNQMETHTYYVGDRSIPVQQWIPNRVDGKVYKKLSFSIIEQ